MSDQQSRSLEQLLVVTFACLLGACSLQATSPAPVDARQSIFPARSGGTLTPPDLAFGGGPWLSSARTRRTGISQEELATYLKPELRAGAARAIRPDTRKQLGPSGALPAARAVGPAPEPAARAAPVFASVVDVTPANPDLERYAQREQRSSKLSDYRGGDVIVLTASTLVIVLLVVILVLLLT